MSDLENDIARIAALRGRGADTADLIEQQARGDQRIAWADVDLIFKPNPNVYGDIAVYDALPEALRLCLREHSVVAPLNAMAVMNLLRAGKSVDAIIVAVQQRRAAIA